MSTDPIRTALERLIDAIKGIELEGVAEVDAAIAAARAALQERQTAPADEPAVPKGREPVTPPPELVTQWIAQVWHEGTPVQVAASDLHVATQAARWGADQELEACINEIARYPGFEHPELFIEVLREIRRPLPSGEGEE